MRPEMSENLKTHVDQLAVHVARHISTLKMMLSASTTDQKLHEEISLLLRKGASPKTAFTSACGILRIVPPDTIFNNIGQTWTAKVHFSNTHVYDVTTSGSTKSGAEFSAYTVLISSLH